MHDDARRRWRERRGGTMGERADSRTLGLRERKKLKVRHEIERCALQRVLAFGYDETTVDAICRDVDISKKTFFNYFSSKEAALLGEGAAAEASTDLMERLEGRGATPYLEVVAAYIAEAMYPPADDAELMRLRSKVISAIPDLAFRSRRDMVCLKKTTFDAVRAYLGNHPDCLVMPEESVEAESVVAVSTALNVARSQYLLTMCCGERGCSIRAAREMLQAYIGRVGADADDAGGTPALRG